MSTLSSIGPIAKPDEIRFAEMLPKTRSGKIIRRLLKQVASGHSLTGNTSRWRNFRSLPNFPNPKSKEAGFF